MGMADGGLVDLLVPSDTFPDANYAGGGIVAFNAAGPVVAAPAAPGAARPTVPSIEEFIAERNRLYQPDTTRRDAMARQYEAVLSPEAQEKSRKEDLYTMLAQIGFGMAGTNSPSFLQAAGQAANAAIPGAVQARKERKAEQRQGMAALADIENMTNAELRSALDSATSRRDNAVTAQEKREADAAVQALQYKMHREGIESTERMARAQIDAAAANARRSAGATRETDTEREIQRRARFLRSPAGGGLSEDAALSQAYDERAGAAAYARADANNSGFAALFGGGRLDPNNAGQPLLDRYTMGQGSRPSATAPLTGVYNPTTGRVDF
jgi:hypothetical protein